MKKYIALLFILLLSSVILVNASPPYLDERLEFFSVSLSGGANGDPDATGFAWIYFYYDTNSICLYAEYQNVELPITMVHIHNLANEVVLDFAATSDSLVVDACLESVDPTTMAEIAAASENYYVNFHNAAFPNGAMRGTLIRASAFTLTLAGGENADPDGTAQFQMSMDNRTNETCYQILIDNVTTPITRAEIQYTGNDAQFVTAVSLPITPDMSNYIWGCVTIDEPYADLLNTRPAQFSLVIYNDEYPDGAIRGDFATELLTNASFETAVSGTRLPEGWNVLNLTNDRLVLRAEAANSGTNAFRFRGVVGEDARLVQTADLTGVTSKAGDMLTISAFVRGSNMLSGGVIRVRVTYTDPMLSVEKITLRVPQGSYGYTEISGNLTLAGEVSEIRTQIRNRSTVGRFFVDSMTMGLFDPKPEITPSRAVSSYAPLP